LPELLRNNPMSRCCTLAARGLRLNPVTQFPGLYCIISPYSDGGAIDASCAATKA
jgi:hypothetical protein